MRLEGINAENCISDRCPMSLVSGRANMAFSHGGHLGPTFPRIYNHDWVLTTQNPPRAAERQCTFSNIQDSDSYHNSQQVFHSLPFYSMGDIEATNHTCHTTSHVRPLLFNRRPLVVGESDHRSGGIPYLPHSIPPKATHEPSLPSHHLDKSPP